MIHEFKMNVHVPDVWFVEDDKLRRIYRAMEDAASVEIESFYAEERAKG